jgi:predicted Zn-dependent protease
VRQLAEQSGLMNEPPTEREKYQYDMMRAKLIGFLDTPNKVKNEYPASDDGEPAHYARSIAALQVSDIDVALKEIDILLEREPDNPYFHELKGQILFESGRTAESVAPHKRSLELKPGQPLLLINYARSLNARDEPGDVEAAEAALRDALIAEPDNAFAWTQLAVTLEKQGHRPEAQLATAESAYAIGDIVRANSFAHRAADQLERGTPDFRRADDILLITDPNNPDNRDFYNRANRGPRLSLQTSGRDMPFGNFATDITTGQR